MAGLVRLQITARSRVQRRRQGAGLPGTKVREEEVVRRAKPSRGPRCCQSQRGVGECGEEKHKQFTQYTGAQTAQVVNRQQRSTDKSLTGNILEVL